MWFVEWNKGIDIRFCLPEKKLGVVTKTNYFSTLHNLGEIQPSDTIWYRPILAVHDPHSGVRGASDRDGLVVMEMIAKSWNLVPMAQTISRIILEAVPPESTQLLWRQDIKIFPARSMLIGQFKFQARQPYARNKWQKLERKKNLT